jgi:hypothetical protein
MKKYLWVVALVISSLFAGSVAADSSHAQQDQAFLKELAQQVKVPMLPMSVAPEQDHLPLPSPALCNQVSCTANFQCQAPCPGGGYCDRFLKKCNYI